jgi:TetR/AcrR family transcriptional repressor of nem operon
MRTTNMRDTLLSAGLRVLHRSGFNGCAVQDITEAAGVPKGSFYNHFSSKEESALEALGRYAAGLRFDMLTEPGRPALERLRAHFEYLGGDTLDNGFVRGCLAGNLGAEVADHSEVIRAAVRRGFDRWASHIRRVLDEAQEAGDLDSALDTSATALFILSAWEGALIAARAEKSAAPVEAFFRIVFDVVLR